MQILLINPAFSYIGKDTFPLGLGYLAAIALRHGASITIVDENLKDKIPLDQLNRFDLIGLTVTTPAFSRTKEIVAQIKLRKAPSSLIIAGGHHPTFRPEEVLSAGVDVVVRGEADLSFSLFLTALSHHREWSGIPGLSFFKNDNTMTLQHNPLPPLIQNLDSIPFPARQLFRYSQYPQISLITSRGCPYQCSYCAAAAFWQHITRFRSVSNVLQELDALLELYPYQVLKFQDSVFTVNRKRTCDLLQAFIDRQYSFRWICETRGDALDAEVLELMKQAGCKEIMLGLESGAQTVLEQNKRQMIVDQLIKISQTVRKREIGLRASIIFGLPGETKETVEATIAMLRAIRPSVIFLNLATIYPGCSLERYERKIANHPETWFRHFGGHGAGGQLMVPEGMNLRQYRKLAMYLQQEINQLNTVNWPQNR